jgi:RNA polymerase sigma-70 factor (ECF subfamily)
MEQADRLCYLETNFQAPSKGLLALAKAVEFQHAHGMSTSEGDERNSIPRAAEFATTHWSIVLAAGAKASPEAAEALEKLCRVYWYPLYAYVRRQGHDAHEAQDLTQAFFARLLEKEYVSRARRERGRFRSYLLTALNHFLVDEWKKSTRQIRGGGQPLLSLDEQDAEARYRREPVDELDAAKIYERRWAMTLLDQVLAGLEKEFLASGKSGLFEQLQVYLLGETTAPSHAETGRRLGMTEEAVKAAVYRLRRRYRELLRLEIAQTVATSDEIEDELRHLFAVLS